MIGSLATTTVPFPAYRIYSHLFNRHSNEKTFANTLSVLKYYLFVFTLLDIIIASRPHKRR